MKLSAIKRIENEAYLLGGVVSLAQGVPAFSSHPLIRTGVIDAINKNLVDHYSLSAGLPELRALAKEKFRVDEEWGEVVVTVGAIEALSATFLAYLTEGDEVLTFAPYYSIYAHSIALSGAKLVLVSLSENGSWKLKIQKLKEKVTERTKMILLCNPHNPTGVVFSEDELVEIGEFALEHKLLIISDEVYRNFYYGDAPVSLYLNPRYRDVALTIFSFSKDFSLSGWRIGFLLCKKEMLDPIYPVHDALVNCAPVPAQYAGLFALQNEETILKSIIPNYSKHRKLMGNFLEELKEYLEFSWPEGSYYFFPKIKGLLNSEEFCFDMLHKERVAAVPGSAFGEDGEGYIRLCFGRSEEDIVEGMQRFKRYLDHWVSKNK